MAKNKKKNIYLLVGVGVLVVALAFLFSSNKAEANPEMRKFAECIADSGAKFYGTFWCPYCNQQKEMFAQADKHLPYVECSTLDRRGQLPECQKKEIKTYPTWEFADGERLSGLLSLEVLAEKTSCELPQV